MKIHHRRLPEPFFLVLLVLAWIASAEPARAADTPPAAVASSELREPLAAADAAALLKDIQDEDQREQRVASARGLTPHQVEELHEERGLAFADLLTLPTAPLRRAIFEIEREAGDHPEEFMRWRNSFLVDETGTVDPAAIERARQQALALPLNPRLLPVDISAAQARGQEVTESALADPSQNIGPASWTWKGPGNIGGRIRSMVIHPTQTNRMWVGSVGGGIWYSSNSGVSWAPVNDFMSNLAVSTLAMDPTNPNVMYAGTGEGFYNVDGIRGAGIYKSTDGGVTWNQLASTANSNFLYVQSIAVSPDGSTVLAASSTDIFGTNYIYRSTNGGTSWTAALTPSNRIGHVEFHPTDSTKAVASGYSAQLYYSTTGGASWTSATGGPAGGTGYNGGRVEVRYARSAPTTLYASFDYGSASQLFKSTNGGATYAKVFDSATAGTANWLSSQGWYANALWVSPVDPNFVVAGGLDIYRSTNGGTSFSQISQWYSSPNSAHADHHGIVADPGFNGTTDKLVYFTNDGGIYKTADVTTVALTTGWQELNNQLGITQFYGAAGVASTGVIIAGAQDNGTLVYQPANGTENWGTTFGGDGGYCAADPTNGSYLYGEYVYLDIHRSTNGGVSSSYIYSGIGDANSGNTAEFIAPFILDPNNPATLLAGGRSLWRSADARATTVSWSAIKASDGNNITAIAVAPGNSNVVWVGHSNGNVYKTTNGTAAAPTWTEVDNNATALPNRRVTRIAIDPNNVNRVFVTFGGYTSGNVWGTTDGGASWANRTGTLPAAPVYGFVISPSNSQTLYAGTDVGVFASDDGGSTWNGTNIGPTLASVQELLVLGTNLVTVTHGRGVFTAPLGAASSVGKNDFNRDGQVDILWQNINTGERSIWLMNGTAYSSGVALPNVPTAWSMVGAADFNGDGNVDIVWENLTTGERSIWLMNGTAYSSGVSLGTVPTAWRIAALGDFNGDGQVDIVWQNINTGERSIWLMNGTAYSSGVALPTVSDTNWLIVGAADFNGDGNIDLLWQNSVTGDVSIWLMNGTAYSSGVSLGTVPTAWQIAGTGDFNGDGQPDILWQNLGTGERSIWLMNRTVYSSGVSLGTVPVEWRMRNY